MSFEFLFSYFVYIYLEEYIIVIFTFLLLVQNNVFLILFEIFSVEKKNLLHVSSGSLKRLFLIYIIYFVNIANEFFFTLLAVFAKLKLLEKYICCKMFFLHAILLQYF